MKRNAMRNSVAKIGGSNMTANFSLGLQELASSSGDECPLTVRQAAKFLGVSPQTVCPGTDQKLIPHFRMMGQKVRCPKGRFEPFRTSFKEEVENDSRQNHASETTDISLTIPEPTGSTVVLR